MGTLLALVVSLMVAGCGHTSCFMPANPGQNAAAEPIEDVATEDRAEPQRPPAEEQGGSIQAVQNTGQGTRGSGSAAEGSRKRWIPERVKPRPYFNSSSFYHHYQ